MRSVAYVGYYAVGKYKVTTLQLSASGCDCFVAIPISIAALSISAPMISNTPTPIRKREDRMVHATNI